MSFSRIEYTGDGVTTDYTYSTERIADIDVVALVDDVTTSISLVSGNTFRFDVAPVDGAAIVLYRQTDIDATRYAFPNRSYLRHTSLDGNSEQRILALQELRDEDDVLAASIVTTDNKTRTYDAGAGMAVSDSGTVITYSHIGDGTGFDGNVYTNLSVAVATLTHVVGDIVRTAEYFGGTGLGGATYKVVAAATGTVDGGSFIDIADGKQLQLIPSQGKVYIDTFGAKTDDNTFDNAPAFVAASEYAVTISQQDGLTSQDATARTSVVFTGGHIYTFHDTTAALVNEAVRVDFVSEGGYAGISGFNAARAKNALGFTFSRVYRTTFHNLIFMGFDVAHQWDTNNVDSAIVTYNNCEFTDCGQGVDTISYALSRSTIVNFKDCRSSGTPLLIDCYCDQLRFDGGSYRNGDDSSAFVIADSQVTVDGGIWTPYEINDDARWFDLYDNAGSGSRGITVQGGARFGPESGGIPVVWNYMVANATVGNHLTNHIMFYGAFAPASPGSPQPQASVVILQDNGVNSYAPNTIGFYGTSARARLGLVSTANAYPVSTPRGGFVIDISAATQSWASDFSASPSVPLVEDILEGFLVSPVLYNAPTVITAASPLTIDLSTLPMGAPIQISGASCVIDTLTNAYDGQTVTIQFTGNTNTVEDNSTGGGRLFLAGSADYTSNAWGSITLQYHRAGTKWFELSRSVR